MEILILFLELAFKAFMLAAMTIGIFVRVLVSYAYYVCAKDEEERQADNDD